MKNKKIEYYEKWRKKKKVKREKIVEDEQIIVKEQFTKGRLKFGTKDRNNRSYAGFNQNRIYRSN